MADPKTRPATIDIVNALRLLWGQASDEARPILKAAEEEIKRLRRELKERATQENH